MNSIVISRRRCTTFDCCIPISSSRGALRRRLQESSSAFLSLTKLGVNDCFLFTCLFSSRNSSSYSSCISLRSLSSESLHTENDASSEGGEGGGGDLVLLCERGKGVSERRIFWPRRMPSLSSSSTKEKKDEEDVGGSFSPGWCHVRAPRRRTPPPPFVLVFGGCSSSSSSRTNTRTATNRSCSSLFFVFFVFFFFFFSSFFPPPRSTIARNASAAVEANVNKPSAN